MAVQAFDLVVIGGGPAGICGANNMKVEMRIAMPTTTIGEITFPKSRPLRHDRLNLRCVHV